MPKLPALAALLLALAGTTTGCTLDMIAQASLPSATVYSGRSSSQTTVYTNRGSASYEETYADDRILIVPPSRRAPIIIQTPAREMPSAGSSDARNPVIQAFTANPSNFVPAGQPITFQVVAHDPQDQPMQFNWGATGGTLSTTSGQLVIWQPPAKAGVYTVSTIITNARGGAVSGSQNLIVQADGNVAQTAVVAAAETK